MMLWNIWSLQTEAKNLQMALEICGQFEEKCCFNRQMMEQQKMNQYTDYILEIT